MFAVILADVTQLPAAETAAPDATHPAAVVVIPAEEPAPPPQPLFDVRAYGAKGDGTTFDTGALQKALDAAAGTHGSVVLEHGTFLTAPLTLHAGETLYIRPDATLLGSTRPEDYPDQLPASGREESAGGLRKSLLFAEKADGLVLDGGGTLDGQGQLLPMTGTEEHRPSLLRFYDSQQVTVRHLTLKNPRMWTEIYLHCTGLVLDHLHVIAPADYVANLDGVDICDCQDVTVTNCRIESEDDGICLKSRDPTGLHHVRIENNEVTCFHANAIKLGTASTGPVEDIRIIHNVVHQAKYGGLCLESVDGSPVRNIVVDGLEMENTAEPIFLRLAARTAPKPGLVPCLEDITLRNIRALRPAAGPLPANSITGLPDLRVKRVTLENIYLEMPGGLAKVPGEPREREKDYPQSNIFGNIPGYGFFVRHADDIVFRHVKVVPLAPDARPWLATSDAKVKVE